ncbi:hypothetical protein GCM10025868_37650 [Angustibacter aerolatus]|uniref:Uncharacterized protein n=1 Tax=Angustibacter aerolatus TaxID=1162965 RepID=A0ABQ6JJU8_9ACTN|nr:hypothetical protein GCM10025868_37650 [Angustibacter aerolatus]
MRAEVTSGYVSRAARGKSGTTGQPAGAAVLLGVAAGEVADGDGLAGADAPTDALPDGVADGLADGVPPAPLAPSASAVTARCRASCSRFCASP